MIVQGLGLTRLRSVLLLLGDAVRVAFTGKSSIGRVFMAQRSHINLLRKRLERSETKARNEEGVSK